MAALGDGKRLPFALHAFNVFGHPVAAEHDVEQLGCDDRRRPSQA